MNIKGELNGIKWIGFDRQRKGRRREYILKFREPGQDWRPLTAPVDVTSEVKFRAWARETLENIEALALVQRNSDGESTIEDLADQWLELRRLDKKVEGATYQNNRSHLRKHIVPKFGKLTLLQLARSLQELRVWVRELAGKLSPGRVQGIVSTFRSFVRDARLEKWTALKTNPLLADEVTTVIPSVEAKRDIVFMPTPVAQSLIDKTKEVRRLIRWTVALNTGAGDAELSGCIIGSVLTLEGEAPRLEIVQNYKRGTKEKGKRSELGKTKNPFRIRAIPLNECARAALRYWLAEGWEKWVGRPPEATDPLFPNDRGAFSRPYSTLLLKEDLESNELPSSDVRGRPYEFRCLRRTFSTMLRQAGVDRETREQLMGQHSGSVNTDHYTAEVPEALRLAVQKLPLRWTRFGGLGGALGGGGSKSAKRSENSTIGASSILAGWPSATAAADGNSREKKRGAARLESVETAIGGSATKNLVAEHRAEIGAADGARGRQRSAPHGTKNQRRGGYRGVSWNSNSEKWEVKVPAGPVGPSGRRAQVYCGTHADPIVAARKYDECAVRLLGPGCALNFEDDREDLESFFAAVAESAERGVAGGVH